MLMRAATVVQVLQDLFMFYCMFYFTCDRSFIAINVNVKFIEPNTWPPNNSDLTNSSTSIRSSVFRERKGNHFVLVDVYENNTVSITSDENVRIIDFSDGGVAGQNMVGAAS